MADAGVDQMVNQQVVNDDGKNNQSQSDSQNLQLSEVACEKMKTLVSQVKEYENRMTAFQSDIFKKTAENRRLQVRIKDLEEKNTLNAQNRNNTSSAFTLPSEFKACWEELVKVLILDAFPDFMDKFQLLVPMAQEILILLIESIKEQRDQKLASIAELMNVKEDEDALNHLDVKTKGIFQEYSLKVFQFTDEFYTHLVFEQYLPRCKIIIENYEDDEDDEDDEDEDYMEMLDEAVNSDDFKVFVKALHKIVLHIGLSDPPITLDLVTHEERLKREGILEQYEFKKFHKTNLFCIDGFPKEGLPAVVVYPPPMKGKYVYQGIKSSVITLPEADDTIVEYIKSLKDEVKSQNKNKETTEDGNNNEKKKKENVVKDSQKELIKPEPKVEENIIPTAEQKQMSQNKQEITEKSIPTEEVKDVKQSVSKVPASLPNDTPSKSPVPVVNPKFVSEKPSDSEMKERLVSPLPKAISKSPINIMNKKDEILNLTEQPVVTQS